MTESERCQFLSQLFGPCGMSSRWPQTLPSRYGLYGSSFLAIAFVGSPVNPSDEILHKWNLYVTACSKTSTLTRWQRSVRQYPHVCFCTSQICSTVKYRGYIIVTGRVLSPAASHWATDSVGWRIRVLFFGCVTVARRKRKFVLRRLQIITCDRLFKTALKSLNRTSLFFAMCLCVPSVTGI